MRTLKQLNLTLSSLTLVSFSLIANNALADQVILDDLIVDGSACIGFDCVNGESFGFDTLRMKENNLRIRAQDTSNSASFPSNDWQITFNDASNGGLNKFSIDDIDGGRTPFTIEAGAPSNSLYVNDAGRIGVGTSTPAVQIHNKDGNTPTLRLEQDGTSGFTPQTWDMAGNEANFFIRDATNGSTLPFRIFPGAPSNAFTIEATTGDIGLGTTSPETDLHISVSNPAQDAFIGFGENLTNGPAFNIGYAGGSFGRSSGFLNVRPDALATGINPSLRFATENVTHMVIANDGKVGIGTIAPMDSLHVDGGNIRVSGGSFIDDGTNLTVPDYVFEDSYKLMPLRALNKFISKEKHLPGIKSAKEVKKEGLNISKMQLKLLEKIEELTLYTLKQQNIIEQQQQVNTQQERTIAENSRLKERLASLEKLVTNLASNQKLLSEKGNIIATR